MEAKCKHKFIHLYLDIESASETINVEVCDICCFTKAEIELQEARDRERVLREALKPFANIGERYKDYVVTNPSRPDTVAFITERSDYVRAYQAIKQEE